MVGCGSRVDIASYAGGVGGAGGAGSATGPTTDASHGSSTSSGQSTTSTTTSTTTTTTSTGGPGSTTTATSTSTSSGQPICPGFGDPCSDCASQACPDIYCNCVNDPSCIALLKCTNQCGGDQACSQACLSANPSAISELYLLGDCAGSLCKPSCPKSGTIDPCTKCILQDCAAEANACLAEPECLNLYRCLGMCPKLDLMCQQGCYDMHSTGVASLQAMLQCADGPCTPVCK